jgi:hypothetical protein
MTYDSFLARWIRTSVTLGSDGMNHAPEIGFVLHDCPSVAA